MFIPSLARVSRDLRGITCHCFLLAELDKKLGRYLEIRMKSILAIVLLAALAQLGRSATLDRRQNETQTGQM